MSKILNVPTPNFPQPFVPFLTPKKPSQKKKREKTQTNSIENIFETEVTWDRHAYEAGLRIRAFMDKHATEGKKNYTDAQFRRKKIEPNYDDLDFTTGAWIFDESRIPPWLAAEIYFEKSRRPTIAKYERTYDPKEVKTFPVDPDLEETARFNRMHRIKSKRFDRKQSFGI